MRYHKLRSFFKTIENNFCKLLFKPKDRVATNDKSSIAYECNCSNSKTFYFGESKRSLKSCCFFFIYIYIIYLLLTKIYTL